MRFSALVVAFSGLAAFVAPIAVSAQDRTAPAVGPTLSLSDAIALAKRNNPAYQNSLNGRATAAQQVRIAKGALLPSVSSGFSGDYREGKTSILQGQSFGSTNNSLSTSGSFNASLNISPSALNDLRAVRASQNATEADIGAAEQTLRTNIIVQYVAVLQAQASAELQDTLLTTTTAQLELARAKLQVGTATQLDVDRADVSNGTQRVAALRAHNQVDIEKLRLFQQMGVDPVLSTRLDSLPGAQLPSQTVDQLLEMARRMNPALEAARQREVQTERSVASARSRYFPSLSLSGGLSGYTNRYTNTDALIQSSQASAAGSKASCIRSEEVRAALNLANNLAACNSIVFSAAQEAAIRDAQSKYPFGFTRNPYSVSASLSLPIFNGFQREANVQNAKINRLNAQNTIRQQQLQLTADVTAAWLNLTTSQQAVQLQNQNAATARRALTLAQERYRVGSISLVDLIQSRSDFGSAETSRINAVYDFQRAFAQLESAVGRPLR